MTIIFVIVACWWQTLAWRSIMSLIAFVLIMALILAAGPWVVPRIAASIRRESIVADHSFAGRRTSRAPAFARIAPPGVGAAPRFGFAAYA